MEPDQFLKLMEGIVEIRTEQANLRRELLGNGQPGRIQILEGRVTEVKDKADELESSAAGLRWKVSSISAAGSAGLMFFGQWLFKKIIHTQ